jgi:hypothetical protein
VGGWVGGVSNSAFKAEALLSAEGKNHKCTKCDYVFLSMTKFETINTRSVIMSFPIWQSCGL